MLEGINYIKLGITLFIALTLSNLTVNEIEAYFAQKAMNEVMNSAISGLKKSTNDLDKKINLSKMNINKEIKKLTNERKIKIDKARRKEMAEIQRISAIRKTNDETCRFWNSEYSKVKSDYNKIMKSSACKRASND